MYKRLVFLLVTLLSLKISAQELTVFAINGSAERLQGKDWKSLVKGQPLQGSDRVRTSPQGSLTLLDNERRKVYAVQSAQGGTVEALVGTQRARAKSMTAEAFAEVKKAMFSQPDDRYATRGGVTYRGGNADEQLAAWLDAHITSSFNIQNSSFTVALHATDPATHKAVRSVGVGGTVELLVVNESDEALHVSVLDVDAEGVWSAVRRVRADAATRGRGAALPHRVLRAARHRPSAARGLPRGLRPAASRGPTRQHHRRRQDRRGRRSGNQDRNQMNSAAAMPSAWSSPSGVGEQ